MRCGHTWSPRRRRTAAPCSGGHASSRQTAASSRVMSRGVLRLVRAGSSARSRVTTCGSASAPAPPGPASSLMVARSSPKVWTARVRVSPSRAVVRLTASRPTRPSSRSAAALSLTAIIRYARSRRDSRAPSSMAASPVGPVVRPSGGQSTCSVRSRVPAAACSCSATSRHSLWTLAVHTGWSAPASSCAPVSMSTACSRPVTPASAKAAWMRARASVTASTPRPGADGAGGRAGRGSRRRWCAARASRPRRRRPRRGHRAPRARRRSAAGRAAPR